MKQKLASLEAKSKPETVVEDDFLKDYSKEDITVIEKIVQKQLNLQASAKEQARQAEIAQAKAENELVWSKFMTTQPELYNRYHEQIIEEAKADLDNTFHRPGWILDKVLSLSTPQKVVKKSTVKRQVASTATGGSMPAKAVRKKSVDAMSADEYLEFMAAQGVHIKPGR